MSHDLVATYRVQLHADFGFDAAAEIAGYLAALGVSHLYSSPVLQAAPGSTHGYDVVDPQRVSEALGGEPAFARLNETLAQLDMGVLLDIVPNHMAIGARENAWWWDVLENGRASRYATYFDVDWNPPEARLRNTVLLPILGDHYGRALEARQVQVACEGSDFTVRYFDNALPVAPESLDAPLAEAAQRSVSDELAFLADGFGQLPPVTATDEPSSQRRRRDVEQLRALLAELSRRDATVSRAIDAVLSELNASPAALDAFLERQNYRLTYWRAAERDLDYRRFFDINSLVGVRSEDERVFAETHALPLRWLEQGILDGLRVDHVDGLRDPATYLQRLRAQAPRSWLLVEKILEPNETLPTSWPIAGTTGYDFLNIVGGLFVNLAANEALTAFYHDFTGERTEYPELVYEKKLLMLRETLGSDVNRLTALWLTICQRYWRYRDYTRHELQDILREVLAVFPVYRTYVQAGAETIRPEDAQTIATAIEAALARRPDLDRDALAFLGDLLTLRATGELEAELVMRFQQLTGPAMAKGAEDTAFYLYNRLLSLNEVGGDPARFGYSVAEFHTYNARSETLWPQTMDATSTHDTKRSEDVRARISLLSEIPDRWAETVHRWSARNERLKQNGLPDRNAEYHLYQTLVGAWPIEVERAQAYMQKAAREAKRYTSWTEQNAEYEAALAAFIAGILGDDEFCADLDAFVATLQTPGWVNSLAQTLLKLTSPGVPDIYQGTELWNLSLVDPDNRRPVDYALRRRLLSELEDASPEAIWERRADGSPKLWVIRQTLAARRRRPELFGLAGAYQPLEARGARAEHVVAFARGGEAVTLAPRLVMSLEDRSQAGSHAGWGDTTVEIGQGRWRNELTGETLTGGALALAEVLRRFPVALLLREGDAL